MLEPAQKRRSQRIYHLSKIISGYDGNGIDFNEFIALVQINYGYTKKRALEYLKLLEEANMITIEKDVIKHNKS
jgi:hypothetical protein